MNEAVDAKFEYWWDVINNTLDENSNDKQIARLMYMFGVLEGFEQHDKITEAAVKAAVAEMREGL